MLLLYAQTLPPQEKKEIESHLATLEKSESDYASIDYYSDGKQHTGTLGYESYSFIDVYNGASHTPTGKKIDLKGKMVLV